MCDKKCCVGEIQDIDGDQVEIPYMVNEKIDPWPQTKNKTWLLQTNVLCQMKSSKSQGKSKINMDQIDEPTSII